MFYLLRCFALAELKCFCVFPTVFTSKYFIIQWISTNGNLILHTIVEVFGVLLNRHMFPYATIARLKKYWRVRACASVIACHLLTGLVWTL